MAWLASYLFGICIGQCSYQFACGAQFIFRNEDQFHISVVHIAILTALDGVWIIVGHRLLFHACIEPEHSLFVNFQS